MKIGSQRNHEFECGHILRVQAPPDFANYFEDAVADDGPAAAIWHMDITDHVGFADLRFLAVACEGAIGVACPNS